MACAAKSVSMATNGSAPSPFNTARALYSQTHVSIPSKPLKFLLSSSCSSIPCLFLLKKREPIMGPGVVAAQRDENNPVLLEEQDYEGGISWGETANEAEGQDSDGLVEGEEEEEYSGGDAEYVEPSEDLKIYVGNLPYDVDSENLAKLFEGAGVVEIAEVIYNRETDQSRGFGFVTMSTAEEVERAVEMFHRYELGGRYLTVSKAAPKGSRLERPPRVSESSSNRIYVGNLPWSVDDDRLEQIFSEHGKVVSARVLSDRETGRSRGFGFVVMASESEKNDAIANLDGQNVDGRAIRVNIAEDRPRRGGGF